MIILIQETIFAEYVSLMLRTLKTTALYKACFSPTE